MEGKEFLTVKEAAELLRVTPRTIHRMAHQGLLRIYSVRKCLYFKSKDINALLRGYHGGENPN